MSARRRWNVQPIFAVARSRLREPTRGEHRDDTRRRFDQYLAVGPHLDRRLEGRLVGIGDTGEARDLTSTRLRVQALDVARLHRRERRVDEYLDEVVTGLRIELRELR